MVKTDKQRLEEDVARAAEIQHRNSRPPSLSRRFWAKYRKFQKQAMSSSDRLPIEEHWSKWRITAANFIFSYIFEAFMGMVILFNIFLIIIQTDRRIRCDNPESPDCSANAQDVVLSDRMCLAIYIFELSLRIFVYQRKFCLTGWNVFDAFIVGMSILGEAFGSFFKDAVIIRVIRVMRLVRMLRLLTLFQELYLMMAGMASTVRTLVWATIMLVAVLSVQALVAVELLRPVAKDLECKGVFLECPRCNRAFDSVLASMITFFQTLLMGEGVNELLVPLIEEDWTAGVFLILSAIFVYLGLSNLILTVIIMKTKEVRKSDSFYVSLVNNQVKRDAKKTLIDHWKSADMDVSETISLAELQTAYYEQEYFRSYFESHDMDLPFLQYAYRLSLKGSNKEDDAVTFDALAEAVIQMTNSETGPVMSLVKCQVATIIEKVDTLQNQVLQLTGDLNDHMAINARAYNSEMEHGHNVINAINAINSRMGHTGVRTSVHNGDHNGDKKEGVFGGTSFLGGDWWSKLSGHQPVSSRRAEPQYHTFQHGRNVNASTDAFQWHDPGQSRLRNAEDSTQQSEDHTVEDPINQWAEEPEGDESEEETIHQSDGPSSESNEAGHFPRNRGPDLAEMLKSSYGNPLPLNLPNLDDVQRNFAKLCERVEAQLDRLDSHWIDDANQSSFQSKKEVYAAGARLLGRLGKSMTSILNDSGPKPTRPKVQRNQMASDAFVYFGDNVAPELPTPPSFKRPPMYRVRNSDDNPVASAQNDVTASQTVADEKADKAIERSGTGSAAIDHQGHRRVDQDESAQNDGTRSRTSADAGTRSWTSAEHNTHKAMQRSGTIRSWTSAEHNTHKAMQRSGTRSTTMDYQGRKGRSFDQDEGTQNDGTRSRTPADAGTRSRTAADAAGTRSRTSADADAHKAMQRSGTRSTTTDHQSRLGRGTDQDERGNKRPWKSNSRITDIKEY